MAQLDVVLFAGGDHLVRLCKRAAERLFEEDAGPGLGTGDHHVAVRVEEPVGDGDDLRLLLGQHGAVVGVGVGGLEPLRGVGSAFLVLVGHRDDLGPVVVQPDGVKAVPVVALAGPADDGDAILLHGGVLQKRARIIAHRGLGCNSLSVRDNHFGPVRLP